MKQKSKTWFYAILLLLGTVVTNVSKAQSPPGVYTALAIGTQMLENDTVTGTSKWYHWVADTGVAHINIQLTKQGINHQLAKAELYMVSSGTLALAFRDTLAEAGDNELHLYAGYISADTEFYIKIINAAGSCTTCLVADPIIVLKVQNVMAGCDPVTPCDMVRNGGFENMISGVGCGGEHAELVIDCLSTYEGSADAYTRNCTSSLNSYSYNLGTNTAAIIPVLNSRNGSPNNTIIGQYCTIGMDQMGNDILFSETNQTLLSTALVSNRTYSLSFWVYNHSGFGPYASVTNIAGAPCWITFASSPNIISPAVLSGGTFPAGVPNTIKNFSITTINTWTQVTYTFTFAGSSHQNLLFGTSMLKNMTSGWVNHTSNKVLYVALDDVSILDITPIGITATSTVINCSNAPATATLTASGSTNSYTWQPSGHVGNSIVVSPTVNTTYTVESTNPNGCPTIAVKTVSILPAPTGTIVPSSTTVCPGAAVTLSVNGTGYTASHNIWSPCTSGCVTPSITVQPTVTTTYSVHLSSTNGCEADLTTTITVLTPTNAITVTGNTLICTGGQAATLTASGGSSYTWTPGGAHTSSVVVSPTVTTSYTVSGTYACGTATAVVTVSVTPTQPLTVTATPSVICQGSTSTLTATGATSYTWNPGGLSGNSIVVSPLLSKTYTVSGQGPGGCIITKTVVVLVNMVGNPSITPTLSTICPGQNVTLTASATSATYSWSNGATTPSINVSPAVTTIYTVVITAPSTGCTVALTSTVNVIPSLTVNSATICSGATATLTASGASTYSWNTGAATPSIAVSPAVTTSYTVAGTYSAGCTATVVSTVYVIPNTPFTVVSGVSNTYPVVGSSVVLTTTVTPPGTYYTYNWSPGGATTPSAVITPTDNANYVCTVSSLCAPTQTTSVCVSITSTLCSVTSFTTLENVTLSGIYTTYNNKVITITGTLTLASGANLTFNNCTVKMGTNAKIIVGPTSMLNIYLSKLFSCESMWYGIELQSTTSNAAIINVKGSTIEDAITAIIADNGTTNKDNSISSSSSGFNKNYIDMYIKNWNGSSGNPYNLSSLQSKYVSGATNTSPGNSLKCSNFASASVKARSYAGIYAQSVSTVNVITGSTSSANANTFDNKDYGIILDRTSGHVSNALFKNMSGINGKCASAFCTPPTPTGIGVMALSNSIITTVSVTALYAPVTFSNVQCAVYAKKVSFLSVLNTTIINPAQSNWGSLPIGSSGIGYNGIYAEEIVRSIRLNYNSITNAYFGTQAVFTSVSNLNLLSISNNAIQTGTGFNTSIGINISSAAVGGFNGQPNNMPVAANTLSGVNTGIMLTGLTGGVRVSNNTIGMTTGNSIAGSGIYLNGANTYCQIDNNSINGNSSGAVTTFNLSKIGINVKSSTECKVHCNSIVNAGTGVRYDGSCATTGGVGFFNNVLNYPILRGLELRNAAVMGTQGAYTGTPPFHTVSSVSKNQWAGIWNSANSDQTYVINATSTALNSRFCISTAAAEVPTDNNYSGTATAGDAYTNLSLLTSATAPPITTCASSLTVGLKMVGENDSLITMARDEEYKRIITENLTDSLIPEESKWQLKDFMYRNLLAGNAPVDATVQTFYNQQQNSNIAAYSIIDSLINEGNYIQASSVNNAATSTLIIEQAANDYNTLWLNRFSDPEYIATSSDITAIQTIANMCIHKGGKSVAYARALLGAIYNHPFGYDDDCMNNEENARQGKTTKVSASNSISINLYPNPNNGNFILSYQLKENKEAELMVEDVTGKLIYQTKLNTASTSMDINLKNIRNGIYFVKVINGKEIIAVNKVVVNN
jgi:hypothetical protein